MDCKFKEPKLKSKREYIRQLIIYGFVYYADFSELQTFHRRLSIIGNNLNQIACHANAAGGVTRDEMDEVKQLMEQVWQTKLSALKKVKLWDDNF